MKLTISVHQYLDKLGDRFLDQRQFEIEFNINPHDDCIVCTIDDKPNCQIDRKDLLTVLTVLQNIKC